jgi:RecB family exonuclease
VPEIPRPLPVTAFKALLADPYLWAVENVLGLQEVDHDLREMDPRGFGNLAHTVLETFAGSPGLASSDPEEIKAELFRILRRTVAGRFRAKPLPTVPLQVELLRSRLARFADWQARWRNDGWEVLCVEARTPANGVAFMVDDEPIFLSGRIDRIDRNRHNGDWTLIDYKTGDTGDRAAKARGRDGKWKDLQLPLYRLLLQDLRTRTGDRLDPPPPDAVVHLAYLPLSKDDQPVEADLAPWDDLALESAFEAARTVIRALREDRGVHFRPGESGRNARGEMAALMGLGSLESVSEGEEE